VSTPKEKPNATKESLELRVV